MGGEVITLKNLLSVLECCNMETNEYLTNQCTFIIQCNSCLTLFRSLHAFLMHKDHCGVQNNHTPYQTPTDSVSTNLETIPDGKIDLEDFSTDGGSEPFNKPASVATAPARSGDLRERLSQKRKNLTLLENNTTDKRAIDINTSTEQSISETIQAPNNENFSAIDEEVDELINVVDDVEPQSSQCAETLNDNANVKSKNMFTELAECPYCSELFPSESERDQHIDSECPNLERESETQQSSPKNPVTKPSPQKDSCNDYAAFASEVSTLNFAGKRKGRFPCNECGAVFSNRGNLSRHEMIHKRDRGEYVPPTVECPYCHKRYANEKTLSRHIDYVHGLPGSVDSQQDGLNPLGNISRFKHCRNIESYKHSPPKGRENKKPKLDPNSSEIDVNGLLDELDETDSYEPPSNRKMKTTGELLATRISDAELSIYVDLETKQCLICFSRYQKSPSS